jgi:hypothetical protein
MKGGNQYPNKIIKIPLSKVIGTCNNCTLEMVKVGKKNSSTGCLYPKSAFIVRQIQTLEV